MLRRVWRWLRQHPGRRGVPVDAAQVRPRRRASVRGVVRHDALRAPAARCAPTKRVSRTSATSLLSSRSRGSYHSLPWHGRLLRILRCVAAGDHVLPPRGPCATKAPCAVFVTCHMLRRILVSSAPVSVTRSELWHMGESRGRPRKRRRAEAVTEGGAGCRDATAAGETAGAKADRLEQSRLQA